MHAHMLVKADKGWIDQLIGADVSLLEEKSSLPTQAEKHDRCLMVIIDALEQRVIE
jgi:hypothetical protein